MEHFCITGRRSATVQTTSIGEALEDGSHETNHGTIMYKSMSERKGLTYAPLQRYPNKFSSPHFGSLEGVGVGQLQQTAAISRRSGTMVLFFGGVCVGLRFDLTHRQSNESSGGMSILKSWNFRTCERRHVGTHQVVDHIPFIREC